MSELCQAHPPEGAGEPHAAPRAIAKHRHIYAHAREDLLRSAWHLLHHLCHFLKCLYRVLVYLPVKVISVASSILARLLVVTTAIPCKNVCKLSPPGNR